MDFLKNYKLEILDNAPLGMSNSKKLRNDFLTYILKLHRPVLLKVKSYKWAKLKECLNIKFQHDT